MLEVDVNGHIGGFQYDFKFAAEDGVTAVWGPSGSGKTTLLNLVSGLENPDFGRIEFAGAPWFDNQAGVVRASRDRKTGLVPQQSTLFPHMSVRRNLDYARKTGKRIPSLNLEQVAELLDISKLLERYPANLSGGEKRRVSIGRALLSDPQIILLDEPFSGLDDARISETSTLIRRLNREQGIPAILVTHAIHDVLRLADQVVLVAGGTVTMSGSPEMALRNNAGFGYGDRMLTGIVNGYDPDFHLITAEVENCKLSIPGSIIEIGSKLRILVRARDVLIARDSGLQTSAQNHLSCVIKAIDPLPGQQVRISLGVGAQEICSDVTEKAVRDLSLKTGQSCTALLKSSALSEGVFEFS